MNKTFSANITYSKYSKPNSNKYIDIFARDLRHRVIILSKHESDPALESVVEDIPAKQWYENYSAYAKITALNNFHHTDSLQFGSNIAEEYYQLIIRYIPNLNVSMRIKFKNKIYAIKRVINHNENSKFLIIIALKLNIT